MKPFRARWLWLLLLLVAALALSACGRSPSSETASEGGMTALPVVTIYKSPTCGCCGTWGDRMREAGFEVREVNLTPEALARLKDQYGIPYELRSCHTAVVANYLVEGHVPPQEVQRLLQEQPQGVAGIAVPGMPLGSPGMETADGRVEPYTVFAFDAQGNMQPVAQYP